MNKRLICGMMASVFMLVTGSLTAQNELEVDSFVIVKEYVPTLSQATKIRINPVIEDTFHLNLDLKYEFLNKSIPSKFTPEPIKAATLKGEPLVKLYNHYLITGYGSNAQPLVEYYYNTQRSKSMSIAAYGRHHSSTGLSKVENSGFSNNAVGLSGNKFTRKMTYTADLKYSYDQMHYYGYSPNVIGLDAEEADKNENTLQLYNAFRIGVSAGNNRRDTTGLKHKTKVTYDWVQDRFGSSENRFVLGQDISKIHNKEIFTISWSLDYNSYSGVSPYPALGIAAPKVPGSINSQTTIFKVAPGVELRGNKWVLAGAFRLAGDFGGPEKYYFYPLVHFRFNLIKEIIIPYASLTGDLYRNSFNLFRQDNPFISSAVPLFNTSENYKLAAGIKGNLSKNTAFNIFGARSSNNNLPLYVKEVTGTGADYRRFTVVYDKVDITEIGGELIYEPVRRWKLILGGKYFMYDTEVQKYAWHKPNYRINLLTKYYLGQKIEVELLTHVIGSQKALDQGTGLTETLKGTVDVNLGFDYRYTKNIAVFLDFNNIASIKYQKWQDYPTMGFNVLGGFKFSF